MQKWCKKPFNNLVNRHCLSTWSFHFSHSWFKNSSFWFSMKDDTADLRRYGISDLNSENGCLSLFRNK
ncbi:unnamed protein product [Blepharisma stoltei]|uniref:Uncharacterized protein n=1 Tax=Blepharisma stoltei TaxID=1481888 RepID=A0AAU9KKN2_9CILI|nr:unnamed protein product [Blepharisma stoltei]